MGITNYLPRSWVPFAELARIHKPAAILYIYFPYLFGSLFASCVVTAGGDDTDRPGEIPSVASSIHINANLLLVAFVVRSAGCTWNDMVDRDLDRHVERCRDRPLARGATTYRAALAFLLAQYAILFAVVAWLVPAALVYVPVIIGVGKLYPYAKRVTDFAQLVLGVSLATGFPVGCLAAGVDPQVIVLSLSAPGVAFLALAASYVVWTVVYDTVYAFQDIEADKRIRNRTLSIRFEKSIGAFLIVLVAVQLALLFCTGYLMGAGLWFYLGGAGAGLALSAMVVGVRPERPDSCSWWFNVGSLTVGGSYTACLGAEYLTRLLAQSVS